VSGVHVAAVQADDEGQVGAGESSPVGRAAVDEDRLLGVELVVEALGDGLGVVADSGGVQSASQREDLGQELGRQPVGGQPGELGLQ